METTTEAKRGPRSRSRDRESNRTLLGGTRQKLGAKIPKGMVGRWFNDVPGRIQEAISAGYTFTNDAGAEIESKESARSEIVGTKADGSALQSYLMVKPEDWHEEDQRAKQGAVDQIDEEIKRGVIRKADPKDKEAYYVPKEGIHVRTD